jgi:hypothetical protein
VWVEGTETKRFAECEGPEKEIDRRLTCALRRIDERERRQAGGGAPRSGRHKRFDDEAHIAGRRSEAEFWRGCG